MITQHTQGEWAYDGEDMDNEAAASWDGNGYEIFTIDKDGQVNQPIGTALNEEDARLMTAAPKLLEALEELLEYQSIKNMRQYDNFPIFAKADSAIAAAKGESS